MAITSQQAPDYIHSMFNDEFYLFKTNSSSEPSFFFKYGITIDSDTFNGRTVALQNKESFISPNGLIKINSKFNFKTDISNITDIPDSVIKYGINITDSIGTDSLAFTDRFASRADEYFNKDNYFYINNSENDLLSKMGYNYDIYCDTELNFRAFNGYFKDTDINYRSRIYNIIYKLYDASGVKLLEFSIYNPYTSTSPSTTVNNKLLTIPGNINQLNNENITVHGVRYNDVWQTVDDYATTLNIAKCEWDADIDVSAQQCACSCINKITGVVYDGIDCADASSDFGCSDSRWITDSASSRCVVWNSVTDREFVFGVDNPDNAECRTDTWISAYNNRCAPPHAADKVCVLDIEEERFVGDVTGDPCFCEVRDWASCLSDVVPYITNISGVLDNSSVGIGSSSTSNIYGSKIYNINYICNTRFDGINVAWENLLGGVDFHLFTLADEKTVTSKKLEIEKSQYEINSTGTAISKLPYRKQMLVARNVSTDVIEANTNWLTQAQINGFEDIFKSTEIYINYQGVWRYVINASKTSVIFNKKRKGLKKYKLNFILSEKKYR